MKAGSTKLSPELVRGLCPPLKWAAAIFLLQVGFAISGSTVAAGAGSSRPEVPVLLMFHSGGFLSGAPSVLDETAALARKRGFRTVQVPYTLGDGTEALRDAREEARSWSRRHVVFSYGESAGGTLACRLAEANLVMAAGCMSPVADIVTWARSTLPDPAWRHAFFGTRLDQERLGLIGHPTRSPVVAELGRKDYPVIAEGVERWIGSDPGTKLLRVPGGHLGEGGSYEDNVRMLLRWLDRRS